MKLYISGSIKQWNKTDDSKKPVAIEFQGSWIGVGFINLDEQLLCWNEGEVKVKGGIISVQAAAFVMHNSVTLSKINNAQVYGHIYVCNPVIKKTVGRRSLWQGHKPCSYNIFRLGIQSI